MGTLGGELSGIQKSSSNASIGSNVSFGSSTGDNAPSSFALRNKEKKKKKKKAGFVSSDNSSSFGSNVSGTERGTDASEVSFRQSVDISGHQKQASPNMKTAKGRKGTMATIQSGQLLELQKQQAKNSDRMSSMSSNSFDSDSGDQDRGGGGHQRTTTIVNKSDRSITLGLDERITTTLGDEMGDFTTNPMAEAYDDPNSRKQRLRRMTAAVRNFRSHTLRKPTLAGYWYKDDTDAEDNGTEMMELEKITDEEEKKRIHRQRKKEKEYRRRKKRDEAR